MIVDGYVRVSQVGGRSGESFISPDVQREQIERWAELRGVLVGQVFEELDESGGRRDRPLLEEAIARVERGDSQGLVVAYMSRFGRSNLDGLIAIDRITKAGGIFASVQEGLDFSTDIGRHMLRSMLSWAEWEFDRTRSNWAAARERAIARGLFIAHTPFGYRKTSEGRLVVDPSTGPVVTDLFRRRADGARICDLRRLLEEKGIKTVTGNPRWTHASVSGVLRGQVYLGESRHGAFLNPAAHTPLVDKDTWERAQFQSDGFPLRGGPEAPLLSGLVRCAGCRRTLQTGIARKGTSAETRAYFCGYRHREEPCPAPAHIRDTVVEPYLEALFWEQVAKARRRPAPRREAQLRDRLDRRERELAAYRDNPRLVTSIGADRFAQGLAVRARRVDQARLELSRAQLAAGPLPPPVGQLRRQWPTLTGEERRAAIATVIECAFVYRGGGRLDRRLFVCLRGRAPADLPERSARRPVNPRPFHPASCPPSARLRGSADWSEAQLREALRTFLAGRTRWPSFPEFQAAGLALVYKQVERHGGARRWARLLDLRYVPPRAEGEKWPEDRIHAELRLYLAGKTVWPGWNQFRRDGRGLLRSAVKWTGGPERWAPEIGIDLPANAWQVEHWSYARLKADLASFTQGRTEWPVAQEFKAAGLGRLYQAIMRANAREQLASELGLYLHPDRVNVKKDRWTEPAIKAALDQLLEGRTIWPTRREFCEAGLRGLDETLCITGRRDAWADRYGLRMRRRG